MHVAIFYLGQPKLPSLNHQQLVCNIKAAMQEATSVQNWDGVPRPGIIYN